jgi:hypothetical protein
MTVAGVIERDVFVDMAVREYNVMVHPEEIKYVRRSWNIQCVPLAGSPGKCWFTKRTKVQYIPVMKCGCVFWEFTKSKLATRKVKIRIINTKRDG